MSQVIRIFALARILTVVIPDSPNSGKSYADRGWAVMEAMISSYCSRIIYHRGKEEVEEVMRQVIEPERVVQPVAVLRQAKYSFAVDEEIAIKLLLDTYSTMTAIPRDKPGFRQFCTHSRIAWLKVSTVKRFAERPGPFPRRQELPPGTFVLGTPEPGRRKFVVTHGWESEVHPSPSGWKMQRLAEVLSKAGARDDDCVFFDFCSNAQEAKMGRVYGADEPYRGHPPRSATAEAYFAHNDVPFISPRTAAEEAAFTYAMWDMGRLYAFGECEIIVLPEVRSKSTFPAASTSSGAAWGCADTWGMENSTPYEFRGWCCSEFATALASSPDPRARITNFDDPAVQHVLHSRCWPASVAEYAQMMRYTRRDDALENEKLGLTYHPSLGVEFTSKGDRLAVKYNFFKMTFDPQECARELSLNK